MGIEEGIYTRAAVIRPGDKMTLLVRDRDNCSLVVVNGIEICCNVDREIVKCRKSANAHRYSVSIDCLVYLRIGKELV